MPAPARNHLLLFGSRIYRYLLGPFRFSTDQVAPLTSPYTEGGAVGSLTVTDTGNKLSVSSARLQFASNAAWGSGMYSTASLARTTGRALFMTFNFSTRNNFLLAWGSQARVYTATTTDLRHCLYLPSSSGLSLIDNGADLNGGLGVIVALAAATDYQIAIIQRGTGAFYLIRGGAFTAWTLFWVSNADTTTPLYAQIDNNTAIGALDDLRAIDLGTYDARFATDYGIALNRSTFTAANGTALTAITPEAGGTWTQRDTSIWQVSSNKAIVQTVGTNPYNLATIAATAADAVIECTFTFTVFTSSPQVGIVCRYTDYNNFWLVALNSSGNLFMIIERAAGVQTTRASTSPFVYATGTDYRVVVVLEGSTITAYISNGNKITYASATSSQSATVHGLAVYLANEATADDFAVYPRTLSLPAGI